MKSNHTGKLKKVGKKLIPFRLQDEVFFTKFKDSLEEGAIIQVYMEELDDDASLAQLAKFHAILKELSIHTGYTPADLKVIAKDRAGLCISRTIAKKEFFECKSLGDASSEELSLAIQALIDIGEKTGHPIS